MAEVRVTAVARVLEAVVGNALGSGVYRRWVDSLGLAGDERVLDVGTGAGACARHIAARLTAGGRLTCVDPEAAWLDIARGRMRRFDNVDFVATRAQDLSAVGLFDVVTIHFVVHDIPEPARGRAVDAIVACLKAGGRVHVREPIEHGMDADELRTLFTATGLVLSHQECGAVPLMGRTLSMTLRAPRRTQEEGDGSVQY